MIITKTPFRISFAGGGSDLADFYEQYGGCVLSTSINRYCYISIHPYFNERYTMLKYSENELVESLSEIKHRIFNCVLNEANLHGVEITSTADIPGGTGLGSSSTFTVGLLNTVNCYRGKYMSKGALAEKACEVEIQKLGSPIGKQDQYAAAFGGLNFIRFHKDGTTSVAPIVMQPETYRKLQKNLVMFYTGDVRSANSILAEQKKNGRMDPVLAVDRTAEHQLSGRDHNRNVYLYLCKLGFWKIADVFWCEKWKLDKGNLSGLFGEYYWMAG